MDELMTGFPVWDGSNLSINGSITVSGTFTGVNYAGAASPGASATDVVSVNGVAAATVQGGAARANTGLNSSGHLITKAVPASVAGPSSSGLYLGSDFMGYWNGSAWRSYMDNAGQFVLSNSGGTPKLSWNGTTLTIDGNGTFSGALSAATGTFAGSLSAATGTFAGALSAASGTFTGALSGATGSFSGTVTAGSGVVTLDSTGIYVTDNNSGSISTTNGYRLTSSTGISGSEYGLFGWSDSSVFNNRYLTLRNGGGSAGYKYEATLVAYNDASSASAIGVAAYGSSYGSGLSGATKAYMSANTQVDLNVLSTYLTITSGMVEVTGGAVKSATAFWVGGDNNTGISGGEATDRLDFYAGGTRMFWDGSQLFPEGNGTKNLGVTGNFRWQNIYLINSPVVESDAREKENVRDSVYGSDFLLALRPVDWEWKRPEWGTNRYQGFLAQDVARIAPAFSGVSYGADGVADSLRYESFIAPIVKSFQEHEERIRELERLVKKDIIQ